MKVNEFLYASEAMERHREGCPVCKLLYTLVDESLDPQLQEELTKARLITILQSVPGIG
jgi:hypothetical protein